MFQILLWSRWKRKKREVPLRTAYSQAGRSVMQPKAKHSLRAQAQLMRTETVETFELVKVEPKLLEERKKENERELNNHDVQELWFQQDGATCHTACSPINLLKDTFGDRLISRFGPVNWPPRSCDLTPLDYFLWGYVMSLVYADKPQTLDHLEDNIRRVIADIRPQMLEKVIENWTSRLDYIRASRGSPMPELEVSEELGIAQSVIFRLWQRFRDDDNVSRCYSTGRPRVTTPNEDQHLAVTAKRNRRSTTSDLSRQLSLATGTSVSRQTVYRHLGHIGLYARRFVRCVPLTATHCHLRLTWSREDALWTPQQWSCVMFSDDSRFTLQSDAYRTLIWRAPVTRYHQENTIERHRHGGAGWLVWGGIIILGSRNDLHIQSVTIKGYIYRDGILEQHVCLFRGAMGAELLFMDDNTRPHRANIVDECLQSEDITRMD
ncbi:transposable element Tcb1 transposase [Trichonephila clavipes]|nr:transposable element Tcb1 transposase [Trichonephila clavipes]